METFEEWLREQLDEEQREDLASHGADAGWPGLCYYNETCALYDKHEDEIWEALEEDASEMGLSHPLALVASFGGSQNVHNDAQFKNLLVWYMAERVCQRETA